MKKALPYLIFCVLCFGFYFITKQDDSRQPVKRPAQPVERPTSTPAEEWAEWVRGKEEVLGYDVLGVVASAQWLAEHRDAISIPEKLDFLENHILTEMPFVLYGIAITADHNGKYRVFSRQWLPSWPPAGFMNEAESIAWLEARGYSVEKTADGYNLKRSQKKSQVYGSSNVNISVIGDELIGWGALQILTDGTVIKTELGRGIAIKPGGTQR